MDVYLFDGENLSDLPTADDLSVDEIKHIIDYYKNKEGILESQKRKYFKLLLLQKRMTEKVALTNLIRKKLNIDEVSGFFDKADVAKVLGISYGDVKHIEESKIRILKHPKHSRKFKEYLGY